MSNRVKRIMYAIIVAGFTAMASQIVLMRELLIVFYGNELSFGITLAAWLFWTGFGSIAIGRRLVTRLNDKTSAFALCQVILAFLLPLSILGIRLIPGVLNVSPGEIIGILPMAVSTFILLAPICILGGFLFVAGCEIYKTEDEQAPHHRGAGQAVGIGYVYIFEAIGAALGGLLTSLILIRHFTPLDIMAFVSALNLLAAISLLWKKKILVFSTAAIFYAFVLFILIGGIDFLRGYSLGKQWKGYDLLASKNSVYGNIAVTRKANLYTVFTNGLYAFTIPDKLTSEMNTHFPLLEHPDPEDVLLIGGGSSGQLKEVLKHPVKRVDYVELDPMVIGLAKKYLPVNEGFSDPRLTVITDMDGRLFIKRTDRRYDVVMINFPEPYTAQINRFYTKEFYLEVLNILKDKGILSFSLYSNPNYMSLEQAQLYLSLKETLEGVFADVKITPGEANHFLASNQKGFLTLDWRFLMDRLKARNIETKYMREYYLYSDLSGERIETFAKRLAQPQTYRVNRDFRPIAYYYDMVLWSTYFRYNLKKLFKVIDSKKIYMSFALLCFVLFIPILLKRTRQNVPNWAVLTCVGTTGFAETAFQIITLVSFQVMYGYVYYKLGIILTSYMIGLVLGSWLITKSLKNVKDGHKLFIKTQGIIFVYPLLLPLLLWVFSRLNGKAPFWLGSNVLFPFLPVIPGLIGGFQFPLANKLYLKSAKAVPGRSAGMTYGIDLLGSCLGGILIAVFLIPIIGIYMSCLLVAGLNLVGFVLLLGKRPSYTPVM